MNSDRCVSHTLFGGVLAWLTGLVQLAAADLPAAGADPALDPGRAVYDQHCAACHGVTGAGDGPASVWLYPRPRDFSAGLFKIKSTPDLALPSDEDLARSIERGLPGSSMPAFPYLTAEELQEVVQYVKHLTARPDATGERVNLFAVAEAAGLRPDPVVVPPETPGTLDELVLGREVYQTMQCALCHGETGAGDGPQVPTLIDAGGLPVRPRDFNTESFRGGHTGRDLYLRIQVGLPGTPMVPYGEELMTPAERWALVHYVRSLRRTDVAVNDLLAPEDGRIPVVRVATLPDDPLDAVWDSLDSIRVPLNPLWLEPDPVYAVNVTAITDARRLALLLQWRDSQPDASTLRVQDFQDAVSVQFSMTGRYSFLGMGDADNPVNLWQWKAGWEPDAPQILHHLAAAYPSMHVDTYFATNHDTARDAGNLLALPHRSPVEDANARGFGSFRSQPPAQQNVDGRGVWRDGAWNVLLVRDLESPDPDDVVLTSGRPIPVAFAVWNGHQTDRNGRKMVSNWFQLMFDNLPPRMALQPLTLHPDIP